MSKTVPTTPDEITGYDLGVDDGRLKSYTSCIMCAPLRLPDVCVTAPVFYRYFTCVYQLYDFN